MKNGGRILQSDSDKLDQLDLQIVQLLQRDSRISFNKVAARLGISVGTAYNRIKNLEEKKFVRGYTVLLDPVKLGYSMTALILIQTEGAHITDAESEISKIDNVISVYDITGDFDIAVVCRFKDRDGLNTFVKKVLALPHIKRTVTNVALNVIKEDFRIQLG